MLLVCRKKKKIQAFSCKLKQKASLQAFWRRSKLERKKKTVARAIEWQILILLLRLIYWAIYQHGVFHCSEAADEIAARCPVVHALITGLTCPDSWGKEKKKLQSIPIKVSSGLSEILCICNSGKVKHGSCSLENSELYYFSQRFPFSSLAVTPLNGSMHSILSAGVEGQVFLLLMLGILSLQFVLGHFNSCN